VEFGSFVIVEVVAFVVDNEVEDSAFGQLGGCVQKEATVLHTRAKYGHAASVALV
jgi:hypothetical protein